MMNVLKNSLFGLAICATLALTSCDSGNDVPVIQHTLPEVIAQDFNSRFQGYKIEDFYAGTSFYRNGQQETDIYSVDNEGNECFVTYLDNVWNQTVQTLPDMNQLPDQVRVQLYRHCAQAVENGFDEIMEISQNCIDGKYYILKYLQDTPLAKDCTHTLVIASDGTVLKLCTYYLNNPRDVYPVADDVSWISKQYKGAVVLGYVNDMGDDNYIIMHNGMLKSVYFDTNNLETKWKRTTYALPEGMSVPKEVLDTLHKLDGTFTYTEVTVIEAPEGIYYSFVDGTKPERPGHTIWHEVDED